MPIRLDKLQKYIAGVTPVTARDMNAIEERLAILERKNEGGGLQNDYGNTIFAQPTEQFRIMQLVTDLPPGGCGYAVPVLFDPDDEDRLVDENGNPLVTEGASAKSKTWTFGGKAKTGDTPSTGDDLFRIPVYDIFNIPSWPMDRGLVVSLPGSGVQRPIWIPTPSHDICVCTAVSDITLNDTNALNSQIANSGDFVMPIIERFNTNRELFEVTTAPVETDPTIVTQDAWDKAYNIKIKQPGIYTFTLSLSALATQKNGGEQSMSVFIHKGGSCSYENLINGIIGFPGGSSSLRYIDQICPTDPSDPTFDTGGNTGYDGVQIKVSRTEFDPATPNFDPGVTYSLQAGASLSVERHYNRHFYTDGSNNNNESFYSGTGGIDGLPVITESQGRGYFRGEFKRDWNRDNPEEDGNKHGPGYEVINPEQNP